ncbi:MAG: flagellar hook capping FlgD N-terminal domain-containing protein [Paracoccus sp. (in: a-proteobacteria)]|nr:flagellar hook capping FlgD N-terminal domain-containing protein [Paracoccus sp. (in: a-proteobacteria)]
MTDLINALGGAQPALRGATTTRSVAGDFDMFLRMLTAQLRNQDPLNPMEGTDFAIQLATFAGVEQQAQTNKLLAQMAAATGGGGGNIASWIGKEARTTAPIWFSDRAVTLDIAPPALADSVQLVTRDAQGREIGRTEIGPGAGQIDWFGRSADGNKLPDGQYSFTLESRRDGVLLADTPVGAYGRIVEAEFGPDGPVLIFEGGGSSPMTAVSALRDAP